MQKSSKIAWNSQCPQPLLDRENSGAARRGEARSPASLAAATLIIAALGSRIALAIAYLVGPCSACSTAQRAAGATEHHGACRVF
jgi:hypothetical protein